MTTVYRRPVPVLAPFVGVLWHADTALAPRRERKLPTGAMQLVVNLAEDALRWREGSELAIERSVGGAGLGGVVTGPIGVDAADQNLTVGVAFRPGGAATFMAMPAFVLAEPMIDLDDVWGVGAAASLRDRLLVQRNPQARLNVLEQTLIERLAHRLDPEPGLDYAISALDRGMPVGALADRLGVASSTLHRRFRAAVGLAPKPFARIRRVQRVIQHVTGPTSAAPADPVDWASVAVTHGYFDQAHLINDFRAVTGVSPGGYRPRSSAAVNHVPIDAAATDG